MGAGGPLVTALLTFLECAPVPDPSAHSIFTAAHVTGEEVEVLRG